MTLCLHGEGLGNVRMTLTCDEVGCGAKQTFAADNYVAQRAAGTVAGWRERQSSAGREFICPACARAK